MEDRGEVERRCAKRRTAIVPARFRERGRSRFDAVVTDLSYRGCRIRMNDSVISGERAWLTLPSLQSWHCSVVWRHNGEAGLVFTDALHQAVADLVIARAQPSLPAWV
jgi:hypothetical protein